MRIGLFSDTFPPEINGVANSTNILYQTLMSLGHDVYVVTTRAGSGNAKWDEDHKILRLAGKELKSLYGYVCTSPFHFNALQEVKKLDLDVIHVQTEYGVGIFARICAKQLDLPLVSTYHTTYEDYTHYANFINSKAVDVAAKKMVARLSKMYGDSCQCVIAPSEKTRDLLRTYKVDRDLYVIPTGLPLAKFAPENQSDEERHKIRTTYGIRDDEPLVVYIGRIAEEKSLDLVVRGFAKAKANNKPIKLLIVGCGPDEQKIQDLVKELGCSDVVIYAGKKPAGEVPAYYHAGDAFVSASLTETQGMTYIEALASGIPLFARKDEVLENLLIDGKSGWFFKDADDLSEKIQVLHTLSREDRKAIEEECLKRIEPYSAKEFAQRALDVYDDAIHLYENMHEIQSVRVKNNAVKLYLVNDAKEEIELVVSLDDYYNLGLRKNAKISNEIIRDLQSKEDGVLAYERCIQRCSSKDRTCKEMYDWLTNNTPCDIETINNIVDRLEEKGFINDARYAEDSISTMKLSLFGEERIIRTLKKKGISYDIIREKLDEAPDDEFDNAMRYANKVKTNMRGESLRMKKNKIVSRMMQRGYRNDLAWDVVNRMDFSEDELNELTALRKCANKACNRYMRKYEGSELRNHIYRYCVAQGYNSEDIYVILDEMVWEDRK